MEKICGIYKITSPSKRIYIGQSINIPGRWKEYRTISHSKGQTRLHRSFCKYGINKHKFEIIHQCKQEELNDLEKYYVDLYQCFNNEYGLNLMEGGGNRGKRSEESKQKIREKSRGNTNFLGKHHTEEAKKMISNTLKINHPGVILTLNTETGIYYNSIKEAAATTNIQYSHLKKQLKGTRKNKSNFIYA